MPILIVRNVPDDVHRALRVRAAQNGRSTEAEVREILASAVMPQQRVRLGDALAMLGREIGLSNADVEAIEQGKAAAELPVLNPWLAPRPS
ncbi:MAG: FitA-like ribbon-helix-helix domain-containing protein [Cupriavidus necator]